MNEEVVVTFIADRSRYNAEVRESRAETVKLADEAQRASKALSATEGRLRAFGGQATDVRDVVTQVENLTRSSKQLNAVLNSKARGQFSPEVLHALEQRAAAVNTQLGQLTGTAKKSAQAFDRLDAGAGALVAKGPRLRDSLGGAATASSGLAGAIGGTSQRASDLLGAADNLAMAFMAGGPLALGLTTIGTGAALIAGKFFEAKKKAVEFENQLRDLARFGLADYAAQVSALEKELENVGKAGIDARIGDQEENYAAATVAVDHYKEELADAQEELKSWVAYQNGDVADMYGKNVDLEVKRLTAITKTAAKNLAREQENERLALRAIELLHQIKLGEEAVEKAADARADAQREAKKGAGRGIGIDMSFEDQLFGMDVQAATRAHNETLEMARVEDLERKKILWQAEFEAFDETREIVESADSESLKRRQAAHEKFVAERLARERAAAQEASSFIVGIATLTGESFAAVLSGREGAEREILKGILDLVGTEMAAKGALFALEGTARLVGGDPTGALVAGVGGAMIIGGAALKAGSVPLVDSLLGGGGAITKPVSSPSSPGGGGLPAPGGGSSGHNIININITNGVGIAKEDTSRAVADGLRHAIRSGVIRVEEISPR